jgi:hypothetical protein
MLNCQQDVFSKSFVIKRSIVLTAYLRSKLECFCSLVLDTHLKNKLVLFHLHKPTT